MKATIISDIATSLAQPAVDTSADARLRAYEPACAAEGPQSTHLRWIATLGALNIAALLIDWLVLADQFALAAGLRLGIVLPFVLVGIAVCVFSSNLRLQAVASGTATVALAIVLTLFGQFADEPVATRYMMSAQFLIFGATLFAALPWRDTLTMCTAAATAYVLIVTSCLELPPQAVNFDLALFCVLTCALGLWLRWREDMQMARFTDLRHRESWRAEQLRRANQRLALLSHTDPLTGLYNRRYLDVVIDRLTLTITPEAGYGVLMIDIDRFKLLNDTAGHLEGDCCLRLVASGIKGALRSDEDTVVRYGGEEFAVVLPHAGLAETLAVAERLRAAVSDLQIPHPGLRSDAVVSISIGAYHATTAESVSDALRQADVALYNAKLAGRNRVFARPTAATAAA